MVSLHIEKIMSAVKINFYELSPNPDKIKTLVREFDTVSKDKKYSKSCPVYRHKKTRTFIGYSPVDFELYYNNNSIKVSNPDYIKSDEYIVMGILDNSFQLSFPNFCFWTYEPDVWLEYSCHPLTSLNNNFTVVEGWFNISNWSRPTSLSVCFVDKSKPIIIKKGDPLFRISFLSPDLDRGIILKQRYGQNSFEEFMNTVSSDFSDFRKENKLFSKTKKKCPFRFLFK